MTAAYRQALRRLGAELICEAPAEAILAARSAAAPRPTRHSRAGGTGFMLVDVGFQPKETWAPSEQSRQLAPREIARFETLEGTPSGSARSRKLGFGGVRERLLEAGKAGPPR